MPLDARWRVFRDNAAGEWVAVCDVLKGVARGESLAELDRSVAALEGGAEEVEREVVASPQASAITDAAGTSR